MQFAELNKSLIDTMKKVAEINSSMIMDLAKQQMEVIEIYADSGNKQAKAVSEIKQFKDLMEVQSSLVEEVSKKLLNNFRASMEIVADAKNQMTSLAEKSAKEVSELNPFVKATA